jgi:glycerol-3-phosphate dehydrogenase
MLDYVRFDNKMTIRGECPLPQSKHSPGAGGAVRDIAIIGGGINGCGIARDAAGRGLSVILAEKSDLASGTSSSSTKLIHGGLRYLEHYSFRLVHESLKEREVLLRIAPHLVAPLRFVLPHHRGLRPKWLIRLGLFLYDHIGGRRSLPGSRAVNLSRSPAGQPLKSGFTRAFEYSDCWVDDARLVIVNAMDAAARGAEIRARTEVVSAARSADHWQIELLDTLSGRRETIRARALVNASGAWVADAAARCVEASAAPRVRLVRGSHIVVPRLFDHASAYIFQNPDRRIVFAIPYEQDYTLIGTTDVDFEGDPSAATITEAETVYLCDAVNEYFARSIAPPDVVWSYSGVRPLQDDGHASAQDATRDFALVLDAPNGEAPLLSLVGGKITTYRHVAEEVMRALASTFPTVPRPWTHDAPLPGGDFIPGDHDLLAGELAQACPPLGASTARRLVRAYGTKARQIFAGVTRAEQLGVHFGADLYEHEVAYLVAREWAMTAEDILWRRSKLGLRLSESERSALQEWLNARIPARAAVASAIPST